MKAILVEDNLAEATLTKYAYSMHSIGTELIHCDSASSLIELLEKSNPKEIAYILLDLNMPKVNGFEVLKRLSQNNVWQTTPVIILSSSANNQDISKCYDLGASAYITKPILLEKFGEVVKAVDLFWAGVNILPNRNAEKKGND